MGFFTKNRFFIFPKTFLGLPFLLYFGKEFGNVVKSRVFGTLDLGKSPKTFPKTVFWKTTMSWDTPPHSQKGQIPQPAKQKKIPALIRFFLEN